MIVLFDFDGVIADTETQYTGFWDRMGKEYLGLEDFGHTSRGRPSSRYSGNIFAECFRSRRRLCLSSMSSRPICLMTIFLVHKHL